jgi:hypothetical protein
MQLRLRELRRVYIALQRAIDEEQPALLRRLTRDVEERTDPAELVRTLVFLADSAQEMARYWADVQVECDLMLEHLRGHAEYGPGPGARAEPAEAQESRDAE